MGPYEISALTYHQAGFSPLPAIGKLLCVKYASGRHPLVGKHQIESWTKTHGKFNVALRLPTDVIALDVDTYKGDLVKLKQLEEVLGKLPNTWNSDSRGGLGGKLLYRVPAGFKWKSSINGITVIQHTHRYVMVLPSYNKESSSMYEWYDGLEGTLITDNQIPAIEDLTFLPDSWVAALKKDDLHNDHDIDVSGINNDELDMYFSSSDPCQLMQIMIEVCSKKLLNAYDGGVHDTGLSVIGSIISIASEGHSGVITAIDYLSKVFCQASRGRDLTVEWNNLLSFVLAHVDVGSISEIDNCELKIDIDYQTPMEKKYQNTFGDLYKELLEDGRLRWKEKRARGGYTVSFLRQRHLLSEII